MNIARNFVKLTRIEGGFARFPISEPARPPSTIRQLTLGRQVRRRRPSLSKRTNKQPLPFLSSSLAYLLEWRTGVCLYLLPSCLPYFNLRRAGRTKLVIIIQQRSDIRLSKLCLRRVYLISDTANVGQYFTKASGYFPD